MTRLTPTAQAQAERDIALRRAEVAEAERDAAMDRYRRAEARAEHAEAQGGADRRKIRDLQSQLEGSRREVLIAARRLADLDGEIATANRRNAALCLRVEGLEEECGRLHARVVSLGHERAGKAQTARLSPPLVAPTEEPQSPRMTTPPPVPISVRKVPQAPPEWSERARRREERNR